LGALVTPAQQNDQSIATLLEIDPVAWTVVNPSFTYTITHRLNITRESVSQSKYARGNRCFGQSIFQPAFPLLEGDCLFYRQCEHIVVYRLQQQTANLNIGHIRRMTEQSQLGSDPDYFVVI
jgi:hypothetical protein